MKQILQNISSGETILEEIPRPNVSKGEVLIRTHASVLSIGTEKMLIEFGKSNMCMREN